MSGFLGTNFFINSFGSLPSHLDRGLYSSTNTMYGAPPSAPYTQIVGYSFSMWYYHDFEISSTSALSFLVFSAGSNDYGGQGIKGDGTFRHLSFYNTSAYHNISATLTTSELAANKWHHFHMEANRSTGGNLKHYIDGRLLATATSNNQVDAYTQGWGNRQWQTGTLISNVFQQTFGVTSASYVKSPTYIAQMVWAQGTDVPDIDEVLNSTSDGVRNLLDINGDGTNTVLDTDRAGSPHQNSNYHSSGIFLFGANSTTDTDTHNSASQAQGTGFTVNGATRTQADPFPVPQTGDW